MSDGPFGLTPSGGPAGPPSPASPPGPPRGRSEVREGARERARELRELHRKRDRNRRRAVTLSVVGGVLLAVIVVAVVLVNFAQPGGRGPLNMLSDGIKIGTGYKAVLTPGIPVNSKPVPSATNSPDVIDIKLYVDYLCPNCGTFERKNSDQLRAWVKSGAATIEIHPIAVLTTKSAGTQYSLRAANAAACVAEFSPNHFFDFNEALFIDQPKEGSAGLTDQQIEARALHAGVTDMLQIRRCIDERRFRSWVQAATARALNGPIPDSNIKSIDRTPTIIVNGTQFTYTTAFDPNEFAQFVLQVAGDTFTKNATPSPSPSPSGSPTAG